MIQLVKESIVDFAKSDLDKSIWRKDKEGNYHLRPKVEAKIWYLLSKYPKEDLHKHIYGLRIVGSICSNLYVQDTDIDVHIIPKDVSEWDFERIEDVRKWYIHNGKKIGAFIGKHPFEIYVQLNPNQDFLSEGVYDILRNMWIKPPTIYPKDYDPYADYSKVAQDIRSLVSDADKLFGELKRGIVDYETIGKVLSKTPVDLRKKLKIKLEGKLREIEGSIESLYKIKKDWSAFRRAGSQPRSPEEALGDLEMISKWRNTNTMLKFVDRYKYMKTIEHLKDLLDEEGKIKPKDLKKVKKFVGVGKLESKKPILSRGDMYYDLLENVSDGSLGDLLGKLAHGGFVKRAGRAEDLDAEGLADAWAEFYDQGSEAAVTFLESYFGFVFDEAH